jgi:uncharacterized LabA/DUF88 family protein
MKLLILVDVQNVFYGSRNFTHGRGRIDYTSLVNELEQHITGLSLLDPDEPVETTVHGYVVKTPKSRGQAFCDVLKRAGYTLRVRNFPEGYDVDDEWRGTVSSMMQMDFIEHASNYDAVVIVSGSGVFAPAFKAARDNWPGVQTYIAAFRNTMHKVYERRIELVDDLIYLGDAVLRPEG